MQYGGGRMGGVPLTASNTNTQNFRNIPEGSVARLKLTIAFGLKSSGSAFASVVSTGLSAAAEGVDDLDLLLNAMFNRLQLLAEVGFTVGNLTPAQWRTILGSLNLADFQGTFINAASVPASTASAASFVAIVTFPFSLERYFSDGAIFAQGSYRLETGQIDYQTNSSLTPSVALANGTAVVSGLNVSIETETGPGSPSDCGPLWKVTRQATLSNPYTFADAMRLLLADVVPASSNTAIDISVGPWTKVTPAGLQAKYQAERLTTGGYDITKRSLPLIYLQKDTTFLGLGALMGHGITLDEGVNVSSLSVYDCQIVPATPEAIQRVSARVGGGGPVTISHPKPASLPVGSSVPTELVPYLAVRITPGKAAGAPGGSQEARKSPTDAAQGVVERQAAGARASGLTRLWRGRR